MKKGGYDYQLSVLKVVVRVLAPLLLLFFNLMFYVAYPISLAKSLLSALPKKGNLALPVNYRGIQMLAALSALYDRILTIRLRGWCLINYLQSAFQQGKSTLHQIFTLRILIEIAKQTNTTLYIGFFDLEKAFDKVSRLLLLKRLRERGIGNCMLQALKRIYLHTSCIIGSAANSSDEFRTYSGIRQGAPSSVLLFICFMDELFTFLETHCVAEPILNVIHCLLHADDTVIISTDRDLFMKKCNAMLKYFNDNSMSLNFPKSSYLIINAKEQDTKSDLHLDYGTIVYQANYVYLGVFVSDTGSISHDIEQFVNSKRANVTIKFNNFLAPLPVKLTVLDVCVSTVLTYGCETWGTSSVNSIEVAYRLGLKRALSIRESTNTEIVYLEANRYPLNIRITRQQLKFWTNIQTYLAENPDHPLGRVIEHGQRIRLPYLMYYEKLQADFEDLESCQETLTQNFRDDCMTKIRQKAADDENSRFGVYLQVNPQLETPAHNYAYNPEFERILVTRYRSGSHNLKIEAGRLRNPIIPRDERICSCNTGVQTLHHCMFDCPLLAETHTEFAYTSIEEAFNLPDIAKLLLEIEKKVL